MRASMTRWGTLAIGTVTLMLSACFGGFDLGFGDGGTETPTDDAEDVVEDDDRPPQTDGSCAATCGTMTTGACEQAICVDGECVLVMLADGTACDDGTFCTVGETCFSGACGGGEANTCGLTSPVACSEVTCVEDAKACHLAPHVFFFEDFSAPASGWEMDGAWELGAATESETQDAYGPDPADDNSPTADGGIAGVTIGGDADYLNDDFIYLTSPVIDASAASSLYLEFYRWLNTMFPPYNHDVIEVYDGTEWVELWKAESFVHDTAWAHQRIDITAYANPKLRVRFGARSEVSIARVTSWNLDDVLIVSEPCME